MRICPVCGKREIGPKALTCGACRKKNNRAYYSSRGICPECTKNPLINDERMCVECRAARSIREYRRYHADPEKHRNKSNEEHRRRYERRKAQGLCTRCGRRKAAEGKASCKICMISRNATLRSGITRAERPAYGLCYFCGQPLDRDGRTCKKCAERVTKNLNLENMDRSNHPWRKWRIKY